MPITNRSGVDDIVVLSTGDVSVVERGYAREKVHRLLRLVPAQVQLTQVVLEGDRAGLRAIALAELDVDGRRLRARAAADTVFSAVNGLEKAILSALRLDVIDGSDAERPAGQDGELHSP